MKKVVDTTSAARARFSGSARSFTRAAGWMLGLFLVVAQVGSADGQDSDLRKDPGYVDVEKMGSWFESEANVEVNVKGALLNMIAEASRFEDPDLSVMLHRLKAIQVRAYELSYDDFGRASGKLKDFGRVLERDGWETVVRAREDDEHVEMYLRTNGMRIAGLVVLALDMDEGEAVMVNIVGEIDPDEIGRLSRRFNFGVLD